MKTCSAYGDGWTCSRPARSKGLCNAHYKQQHSHRVLRPVHRKDTIALPGPVRVSPRCAEMLQAAAQEYGTSVYQTLQLILEAWGERQQSRRS